ncbi:hypothetical protein C8Q76DRAFT_607374, partial [Earliella scabrosa]
LQPGDLLSLSRVDKETYNYLAGPDASFHWRRTRRNVPGLPDCPEWLSEMRFAALCFEQHCQRCLAVDDTSKIPIWQFYVRYCARCDLVRCVIPCL